jgi:hypothetical protein
MVQAIRDQWLIALAIVAVAVIAVWLLVDRWKAGGWRRGR